MYNVPAPFLDGRLSVRDSFDWCRHLQFGLLVVIMNQLKQGIHLPTRQIYAQFCSKSHDQAFMLVLVFRVSFWP